MRLRSVLSAAALLLLASGAGARQHDGGTFVVRPRTDTVSVERRVPTRTASLTTPVEPLAIEVAGGTLSLAWDRTRGTVSIRARELALTPRDGIRRSPRGAPDVTPPPDGSLGLRLALAALPLHVAAGFVLTVRGASLGAGAGVAPTHALGAPSATGTQDQP